MADWPYSTKQWKRLRKAKLAEQHALCEPCRRRGKIVPATLVDHIVAIRNGGDPFPPLDGLQVLCWPCHNRKTAAMDKPGGKGAGWAGAGADGLPIDRTHPFYGGDTPADHQDEGAEDRRGTSIFTKFYPGKNHGT